MSVNKVIFADKLSQGCKLDMMPLMATFGERYKALREAKGVSNYKVWKQTGIAQSNLTNMEKGLYTPSPEVLKRIASIPELEIDVKTLQIWQLADKASEMGMTPEMIRAAADAMTPEQKAEGLKRKPKTKEIKGE